MENGIVIAIMVPHPPLIVPEVGRGGEKSIQQTTDAYRKAAAFLAECKPDTVVVISPHQIMYADYFHISPGDSAKGSFASFDAPQVKFDVKYDKEFVSMLQSEAEIAGLLAGTDKALGGKSSLYYIDANLFKKIGNGETKQIHEADTEISITIVIPQELRNNKVARTYGVVRLHDGKAESIPCSYNEKKYEITVKSDKFSTYAIVYRDVKTTVSKKRSLLLAKGIQKQKNSLKITWKAYKGADGYEVYWSYCDGKSNYKKLKSVSAKKLSYTHRNLKKNKAYKYYVRAYKKVDGKKVYISKSPRIHVAMDYNGRTNAKKIKLNKKSVTLKSGKKFLVKAMVKKEDSRKKLLTHLAKLRYYTDNAEVAQIDKTGKIKAKKKGKCTIYVIANNGEYAKVTVIVK